MIPTSTPHGTAWPSRCARCTATTRPIKNTSATWPAIPTTRLRWRERGSTRWSWGIFRGRQGSSITPSKWRRKTPRPLKGRAEVALYSGDMEGARRWLDQAIEVDPFDDGAFHVRGRVRAMLGDAAGSRADRETFDRLKREQAELLAAAVDAPELHQRQRRPVESRLLVFRARPRQGRVGLGHRDPRQRPESRPDLPDPGGLLCQATGRSRAGQLLPAQGDPAFTGHEVTLLSHRP